MGDAAMKHVIDNHDLPKQTSLPQFLRIERAMRDALFDAIIKRPQLRTDGNARVVAFCRIERGQRA
jgi:hypothetical protein